VAPRAIEVAAISQTYPGVQALTAVTLGLDQGEVVGLVGHNGAGKSTLTRIIAGVERPTKGRIEVGGREAVFHGPQDAIAAGVSVVPQALSVVPTLTIRDNVALGTPVRALGRHRDALTRRQLAAQVDEVASHLGIEAELGRKAGFCSSSVQRLAMIGRALLREPAVMLLDEPTAALHPEEAERMFAAVEALRHNGMAILFISHRLDEVLRVSDRVVVLRQGRVVSEGAAAEVSRHELAELVAGHDLELAANGAGPAPARGGGGPVLTCEGLRVAPRVHGVSMSVARGEVVGLAGLEGSGCGDVLRAMAGLARPAAGRLTLNGSRLPHKRSAAVGVGVAYLPGDRVHNGIIPEMTVAETVTLSNDREFRLGRWLPLLKVRKEAAAVDQLLERLDLHPRGAARRKIKQLSGGNQQKALMARALISGAQVYLFDQPTEGVDVGARQEIHRHIRRLAEEGGCVVVTSSEPDELVELCERVIVMRDGRVVQEIRGTEISETEIVRASLVG
jgi:ABC-type sugar transport system ATPase subunit